MAAEEPKPAEKRRLPVLQSAPEPPQDGPEGDRPPWRRVALGAAGTFLVWLPLSALVDATSAAHAWATSGIIAGHAAGFCAGALAGGALAGWLGAERARRGRALVGAFAALLAWVLALTMGAPGGGLVWGLLLVILVTMGGGAGAAGGRLGERLRLRGAVR